MERVVTLSVPTQVEFASLVRVTAVGLASLTGLDTDKTEDLRLAADEMWLLLRNLDPRIDQVTFTFTLENASVQCVATSRWPHEEPPNSYADSLGWTVLQAITQDLVFAHTDGHVEVRAVVRARGLATA